MLGFYCPLSGRLFAVNGVFVVVDPALVCFINNLQAGDKG